MYVGHHYAQTNTINVNKTCALQQTTDKTWTNHSLCEIYVNITNGVIFFAYHEQYYIDINVQI
jgi:Leu/Phe-tRNA-protein transferase